jgi:tRNA modification GTPase
MREIVRALLDAGIEESREPDPRVVYPEAASDIEARMLGAISRAASPLAIDLLVDQPRRWADRSDSDRTLDRVLNRLIEPPLLVALGAANIGKSTLVNALAGRSVSIVADEPGTTRDHVGVMLDFGGLVVRYLDTPGMRRTESPIEREAQELARQAVANADLVVLMGDAESPPPNTAGPGLPAPLRVALRMDRGASSWPHDVSTSAATGVGLAELVGMVRERMVPKAALMDPRPWKFW